MSHKRRYGLEAARKLILKSSDEEVLQLPAMKLTATARNLTMMPMKQEAQLSPRDRAMRRVS